MRYLKTYEQSLYDKIKNRLQTGIKKGVMWYITNTDEFKELTTLMQQQKERLDKELAKAKKKYPNEKPEVYTIGGEAAQQMVEMYKKNVALLEKTIDDFVSKDLTKEDILKILDDKIKEVEGTPTGPFEDAKQFKISALKLLKSLRDKTSMWVPDFKIPKINL
jgi:hypothetical protein